MKTEKKKLNLADLKIQSFVTSLEEKDALLLKGGTGPGIETEVEKALNATNVPIIKQTFRQGDYNVCTLA